MSRLLHAAARGARIQYRSPIDRNWKASAFLPNCQGDSRYRIHPDDEHLQYGPISTALREMAGDKTLWKPCSYRVLAIAAANEFQVYLGGVRDDYPLFYLFLAEALADEGM